MESEAPIDALARLAPAARAPERARVRIGVGAAVVLLIGALVTAVIVSAAGQQAGRQVVEPAGAGTPGVGGTAGPASTPAATGGIIFVHVLGQVRRPGLFELRDGARVMDVVAAAGGLTAAADPSGVNLARTVSDGEQLYVPQRGEAQPGAPPGSSAGAGAAGAGSPAGAKVNLNTASAAEFDALPRIGPAMAQRIIDYRTKNGRFGSIDDLRNVTGIGDKTFEGLKELITV
jgi:comEA protein